jgi:prepilin-type N-terminal cleavage/methylation domain-containing protein/prepilin-type processing-associated H-X9-DG protein
MHHRRAFTLLELLVVLAIAGLLAGLTLAAVQRARHAAVRATCLNNLRQLALACANYEVQTGAYPVGCSYDGDKSPTLYRGWMVLLLPYLEQDAVWRQSETAFQAYPDFRDPAHPNGKIVAQFICPTDPRTRTTFDFEYSPTRGDSHMALCSYQGNQGRSGITKDGILFVDSRVRPAEVTDGLSATLLIGERPPSHDRGLGWWYGGTGYDFQGSLDTVLGTQERNLSSDGRWWKCGVGPFEFKGGSVSDPCAAWQYWSLHSGGANFAFCDGSVRFIRYGATETLVAHSTRNGGEAVREE